MTADVVDAVKAYRDAKNTADRQKLLTAVKELFDVIGYVEPVIGSWKVPVRQSSVKYVTKAARAAAKTGPACVRCGVDVRPGFCYVGKVLEGFITIKIERHIFNPVTLEDDPKTERKKVSKYVSGMLCDECAGEYRYVTNPHTNHDIPIVIVQGLPHAVAREQRIGGKSQKGFNTRTVSVNSTHGFSSSASARLDKKAFEDWRNKQR